MCDGVESCCYEINPIIVDNETPCFPILTELVDGIFVLPHGNSDVELLFLYINQSKRAKCNRIYDDTLDTCLDVKVSSCLPSYSCKPMI